MSGLWLVYKNCEAVTATIKEKWGILTRLICYNWKASAKLNLKLTQKKGKTILFIVKLIKIQLSKLLQKKKSP